MDNTIFQADACTSIEMFPFIVMYVFIQFSKKSHLFPTKPLSSYSFFGRHKVPTISMIILTIRIVVACTRSRHRLILYSKTVKGWSLPERASNLGNIPLPLKKLVGREKSTFEESTKDMSRPVATPRRIGRRPEASLCSRSWERNGEHLTGSSSLSFSWLRDPFGQPASPTGLRSLPLEDRTLLILFDLLGKHPQISLSLLGSKQVDTQQTISASDAALKGPKDEGFQGARPTGNKRRAQRRSWVEIPA